MSWYNPFTWFSSDTNEPPEKPPKPDSYTDEKRLERTRYQTTLEYRNGDTETFECYGIAKRGDDRVKFNTDPYARISPYSGEASSSYQRRVENYEVLSREPVLEEIGVDEFVVSYRVEWEWTQPHMSSFRASREWCERHRNPELEVRENAGE